MRNTILLVTLLLVSAETVHAEPGLHVIMVSDNGDPDLGEGFQLNATHFESVLTGRVTALHVTQVCQRQAMGWTPLTADMVREAIRKAPVNADDALIVYLACHGYVDPKVGNFFAFADQEQGFSRQSIIKEIKARRTRLGGLITDSCQEYKRMDLDEQSLVASIKGRGETAPLWKSLFLEHEGFLDWSAADKGEFAVYYNNYRTFLNVDPKSLLKIRTNGGLQIRDQTGQISPVNARGGLFTEVLVSVAVEQMQKPLDWNQFHSLVKQRTSQEYKKEVPTGRINVGGFEKEQPNQTVVLTTAPKRRGTQPDPDPDPDPKMKPTGGLRVLFANSSQSRFTVRLLDDKGGDAARQDVGALHAWLGLASQKQTWIAESAGSADPLTGVVTADNSVVTLGRGVTGVNQYGAVCYEQTGADGVVIVQVIGNSQAQKDQVRIGDIIISVNGKPVNDVAAYNAALKRAGGQISLRVGRTEPVRDDDGVTRLYSSEVKLGAGMSTTPPGKTSGDHQLTVANTSSGEAVVRLFDSSGAVSSEVKLMPGTAMVLTGSRGQKWEVTYPGAPAPQQGTLQKERNHCLAGPPPAEKNRLGAYALNLAGTNPDDLPGVVVGYVEQGSVAFNNRIEPGDVIRSINGEDVTDQVSFNKTVARLGTFARIVIERSKAVQADGKTQMVPTSIEMTVQLTN